MNILVLNYEYPPIGGGGAAVTKDICELASANGNHVEVITMNYRGLQSKENENGVIIHRVKCIRSAKRVCHPWEQFSYCIAAYSYIKHNIDINKFDFIHCHFIIPTGLLALWIKRKYDKRYILTAHGSDVIGHNNARFSMLYRLIKPAWIKILDGALYITAPSEYLLNKIRETYISDNMLRIPNGVYANKYYCANKKKCIVTLSRLQESKGIQDLIAVCSQIDLKGWQINILGDGPYKSVLKKMVIDNNLQESVFFRGHVEGEQKLEYLSEAAIFFSGSRFEAFPVSVLEAVLSECYILVSDIEAYRELFDEDHIYRDNEELRELLVKLLNVPPHNVKYDMDKYDWSTVYNKYNELFTTALYNI